MLQLTQPKPFSVRCIHPDIGCIVQLVHSIVWAHCLSCINHGEVCEIVIWKTKHLDLADKDTLEIVVGSLLNVCACDDKKV